MHAGAGDAIPGAKRNGEVMYMDDAADICEGVKCV
jgi:hypothetical protein